MSKRGLFRFEHRQQPLLPPREFAHRLARNFAVASMLVGLSLFAGMAGYHYLEGMDWLDAFASASMILSGMGPLEPLRTPAGKLFAGFYALYSGLAVIVATGILVAPVIHRMLHSFHVTPDKEK
jgi:hypothetical protein